MARTLQQSLNTAQEQLQLQRQNIFYPQARVTLQVVFETFGEPSAPRVLPVAPRSVTVYSNSYKEADTWSIEFDAEDLPVSPELIRAGAAEIALFQGPGLGQLPEVIKAKDDPETPLLEGLEPTIVGLFDDVTTDFGEDGKTVTIDGTDYTALFTAKQWNRKAGNGKGRIPTGRPLDVTVQRLIRQVESAEVMNVLVEPEGLRMPVVGAAEGKTNKRGIPVREARNYWDAIYTLCIRYGFIVFVRGLSVVITQPQAFLRGKTEVRKMAWGRNLRGLRMERRIGREQVPVIEVRSYDDVARRVRKARFPRNPRQPAVTGLGTKRQETRVFTFPGIRSDAQLQQIAETLYNLKARAEQLVHIETMDLRDLEGSDLIELRTGDALAIGFDPFNNESVLIEGQSVAQRAQTLRNLGFDASVAQEIAATFDQVNLFKRPFRVRESTLEWSHDGGLSISAELQNFVNVRGQEP